MTWMRTFKADACQFVVQVQVSKFVSITMSVLWTTHQQNGNSSGRRLCTYQILRPTVQRSEKRQHAQYLICADEGLRKRSRSPSKSGWSPAAKRIWALLNTICHLCAHKTNLSRSACSWLQSDLHLTFLNILASSANFRMLLPPLYKWVISGRLKVGEHSGVYLHSVQLLGRSSMVAAQDEIRSSIRLHQDKRRRLGRIKIQEDAKLSAFYSRIGLKHRCRNVGAKSFNVKMLKTRKKWKAFKTL